MVVLGDISDHAMEIDGPEGTYEDDFTMLNGTLISNDGSEVHFRDGASGYVEFMGLANVVADSGTSVTVEYLTGGADISIFSWTLAYKKGVL